METKDKIAQLGNSAPGIDSLKIPAYQWWSEALHGVAGSPGVHFGGNVGGYRTCLYMSVYNTLYNTMCTILYYNVMSIPHSHAMHTHSVITCTHIDTYMHTFTHTCKELHTCTHT